ncbi:MAG: ABC transporter substrate-binding protein [bacterium]
MNFRRLLAFFCLLTFFHADLLAQEKIIVCVINSNIPAYEEAIAGFREALIQENIEFKAINYNLNNPPPPEIDKADLFFTIGTNATRAISDKIKNIPVVFTMVTNPQFSAQNVTGVTMEIPFSDQLVVLSNISPRPKKIGIIYDPNKTRKYVEMYIKESHGKGFEILTRQVSSVNEVFRAIRAFRSSIDCLFVIPDPTVYTIKSIEDILLYSLREGLPVVGISPGYVKAGALFSISSNYGQMGKEAGQIAARLLRGEKPSKIPYASPKQFDLSINLIVADRIGITFPDKLIREAKNVYK